MKKSIMAKAASIILASSLMLGMTACGDSSSKSDDTGAASSAAVSSSSEDKEITGKTETWGMFTVLVPDGWTLRKGDALDENDQTVCSVKKSDFSYFDLKSEKDDVIKQKYDYNKKTFAVEGLSVSLSLDSKTALRIYYKGDKIDDITAFCGDESVTLKTGTARDMNYVEIDNIPAHHLRDNYEFTFGDKGNATVSVYSYCYLVLANSTNEKLKSTVKAMYEYSEAAKNYFPKN